MRIALVKTFKRHGKGRPGLKLENPVPDLSPSPGSTIPQIGPSKHLSPSSATPQLRAAGAQPINGNVFRYA